MEPIAALIVVISAFLHAAWNAILKRAPDTLGAALAIQFLTGAVALMAAVLDPARGLGDSAAVAWGVAAGILEIGYFVTLAAALQRSDLASAYTVARGGALVLLWPLSVAFLHEPIRITSGAGIVLLLIGLGLISGTTAVGRTGLRWACLCAVTIAGSAVACKQSLAHGAAATSLFALSLGLSVPLGLLRVGRQGRSRMRASLLHRFIPVAAASLACWLSFLLILIALRREGAGAVMTLRNTSVLFALLFSALLGQAPRRSQVGGALLVVIGALLIGFRR